MGSDGYAHHHGMDTCAGFLSCRGLALPVRTMVRDDRVVRMYNTLRGVIVIAAVFVFVFVQRGFVAPVEILVNPNAWMGSSPIGSDTPEYCDNPDYEYYWSDDWVYRNITCKPLSLNSRFIKFLGVGNFFVPTMVTQKKFVPCPQERETTAALNAEANKSLSVCRNGYLRQVGDQRHSFVMWADDSVVSAEVSVSIPDIGYDAREEGMRHELSLPNGTVLQYDDIKGFSGQILTLSLRDWVSLLGLENGLDSINKNIDIPGAEGDARLRVVGMVMNIGVTVTNLPNFGLPGEIYCRWELDSELVWSRITNPDQHLPDGHVISTDFYGMRFRISTRKSEVMLPDASAAFSGIIELAVLLIGMRILAHGVALNCYGKDSKRWKKAAFGHVDNLTHLDDVKGLKKSVMELKRSSMLSNDFSLSSKLSEEGGLESKKEEPLNSTTYVTGERHVGSADYRVVVQSGNDTQPVARAASSKMGSPKKTDTN